MDGIPDDAIEAAHGRLHAGDIFVSEMIDRDAIAEMLRAARPHLVPRLLLMEAAFEILQMGRPSEKSSAHIHDLVHRLVSAVKEAAE